MFESHLKPPISFPSVSGAVCSFDSQYAGLPLKSCVSNITGYQEGSGDPSLDNDRPIHYFTSGTLTANSNTYTLTWGDNVYTGTIDWQKGVMIATQVVIDDYTDVEFFAQSQFADTYTYRFICPIERKNDYFCISNKFKRDTLGNGTNNCFEVSPTTTDWVRKSIFFGIPSSYNTVAMAKQYLIDNGVVFAHSAMTPVEIPLTGLDLTTIQVNNSFSSNTGNTTLQYIKLG